MVRRGGRTRGSEEKGRESNIMDNEGTDLRFVELWSMTAIP